MHVLFSRVPFSLSRALQQALGWAQLPPCCPHSAWGDPGGTRERWQLSHRSPTACKGGPCPLGLALPGHQAGWTFQKPQLHFKNITEGLGD